MTEEYYGTEPPDWDGWVSAGPMKWVHNRAREDDTPGAYKTKSCLIADHGLFVELAPRLARDFGEVKLFVPWTSGYPKAAPAFVGTGLPGVTRVETFWDHVGDADIVVFPDLYFADWQEVVANRFGKPVWGHRRAENLELDRWGTRRLQKELGISAPKTKRFVGVDTLADYLQGVENKWVKISAFRGDGETWHHDTWHTTSIRLDAFRNRVGALAGSYEFMVEDNVEGIEIGYDGFTVRGDWPEASYWGFEIKDYAYIGKFSPYGKLPAPIRSINDKMSAILKEEQATGFCSFGFRLKKSGEAVMIDPCMRCGSPPFEGLMEGYANLAEIIWEGAHGRITPVVSNGKFIAIAMIRSQFALTNWVPLEIPDSVEKWVKLRNKAIIDGKIYHVPTAGDMPEIGAVVAVADSLEEAKKLVAERAEKIKGYLVEVHVDVLDLAEEEIEKAKEYGVDW